MPRPDAPVNPNLPEIPLATGPLAVSVVYPREGQVVASRDSAFIFGSVGHGEALLTINGRAAPVWPNGAFMAFLPIPPRDNPAYDILAVAGSDTARLVHRVALLPEPTPDTVPPPPPPDTVTGRWATIVAPAAEDPDRVIWGPAVPDPDTVRFFLIPGTTVRVAGPAGARLRVELDSEQHMTVAATDALLQPAGHEPSARTAGAPRVSPSESWVDVSIPVNAPPPYLVTSDGNVLTLTLYGTSSERRGDTTGVTHLTAGRDSLLRSVERSHSASRSTYTFNLARDVYGYAVLWGDGQFTVRLRRPPVVNAAEPLRGLTIAVDPGHPGLPGESPGATGPTGLREPDAVLAVGLRLRDMLIERGAVPHMTRSTPDPVPLNRRAAEAARQNSHAYVSIHLNAVPDNVNPFNAHGTSTYYWFPHSRRLAETTHEAALRHMHLRDIGVRRENFALVRNPWMPSVLAEGAFIIMPDQEYALRTAAYQEEYARALLEGLEAYFREIAGGR